MANLENFVASVEVSSGLKPMGNNTFPIAQAHDILAGYDEDGNEIRLDDKLDGIQSTHWYSGKGTLSNGQLIGVTITAKLGDMYLNTDTGDVYRCTKGGSWVDARWETICNIKGTNGKSAYEYAKANGYTGTEEEFALKLAKHIPTITQEAGNSETLVMSQKAVTDLVANAVGSGGAGTTEYETVDSVEEMTDKSKSYVLKSTGTIWTYSEKTTDVVENQFKISEATLNARVRGNGEVQTGYNGLVATGLISVPSWVNPYNVKIKGTTIARSSSTQYTIATAWYDSSGTKLRVISDVFGGEPTQDASKENVGNIYKAEYTNATQVRFGICIKDNVAITNADIENLFIEFEPKKTTGTVGEWQDTGMKPDTLGGENYVSLLVKINENKNAITELEEKLNNSPVAKSDVVWYAVGDSITKGRGVTADERWTNQVLKLNGYDAEKYLNLGISGIGFAKHDPNYNKTARMLVDENDFSTVDLVTVAIGINDWKEVFSIDIIKSEMRYCFEKILADNPYCKIIFIAPFNISIKGSENTNWALGYTGGDVTGGSLRNFIDTQISICEEYGIQVIDMSNSCVINKKSITTVLSDGVHPDAECHKALGRELARRITFA